MKDTQYAAAQLELVSAKKALTDLDNTASTDFTQAVIDLKDVQEEYDDAVEHLDYLMTYKKIQHIQTHTYLVQTWGGYELRKKDKHIKGPAPEAWTVEAENDLALKKAELDDAQRTYDRLKGGADVEQLAVLEAAEAGLAAFSVIAPFDGVVADLNARLSGSINAGESAVTVADFSQWLVQTTSFEGAFTTDVTKHLKETFERHNLKVSGSQIAAAQLGKVMFGATLDYRYNWLAVGACWVSSSRFRSWHPCCPPAAPHASACATAWRMHKKLARRIYPKYRMIEEGNSWRQNVHETQLTYRPYRSRVAVHSLFPRRPEHSNLRNHPNGHRR